MVFTLLILKILFTNLAVQFGLEKEIIKTRVLKWTYGKFYSLQLN